MSCDVAGADDHHQHGDCHGATNIHGDYSSGSDENVGQCREHDHRHRHGHGPSGDGDGDQDAGCIDCDVDLIEDGYGDQDNDIVDPCRLRPSADQQVHSSLRLRLVLHQ